MLSAALRSAAVFWAICGAALVVATVVKSGCLRGTLHMFKCKSNAMSAQLICSAASENRHKTRQERGLRQNMVAPIAHPDLFDPFWWDWFSKTSFLAVTVCMPLSMIIVEHVHCDH